MELDILFSEGNALTVNKLSNNLRMINWIR